MPLSSGSTIGRYEIRELLGTGGMGEVYKAHDPTLGRFVALKLLRADLSADADRITRFLQEARAASALNHPNILTIHEVGDHNQSRFIVSEFVDGETLRARMERGALSLREILDVAIQTASALAAAHAAGIVHRDIKPENLMLRPDGYVKVLDFGVAKLAPATDDVDPGVTRATSNTAVGIVVGTMAYMAPEQARGLHVDGRADSFSLGVVLYELLAGRTPFAGATTSDVLVAILDKEPPPLRSLARGLPLPLEWIIAKALEKDPSLRYQSIADLRVDLLRLKAAVESGKVSERYAPEAGEAAGVDRPIEVELTADSPQVRRVSEMTRWTAAGIVIGVSAVIAAFFTYHHARLGAELPLQVPEGAVLTKARDALQSLGYTNWGSRTQVDFGSGLNMRHVTTLAGLPAARDAVRTGAANYWAVGFSHSRDANALISDDPQPQQDEYAIRLDPTGKIVRFATNASPSGATALDRESAVKLGLDMVRRTFGVDASAFEIEFVQRAFPAGTVEMTWRTPERRFGHIEQFRIHLQGDRVVSLNRSFETPPEYQVPDAFDKHMTLGARVLTAIGPFLIGTAFFTAWAFGLMVLVRTRNWDALKQRLPIAICAILVASIVLEMLDSASLQNLLGVIVIIILLAGTVLPALSGIVLWIRRRSPARLWAIEQLTQGRVFNDAVAISLLEGVMAGMVIAAATVAAEYAGLQIEGYVPSISREVNAVDKGLGRVIADALPPASFLAIIIALVVEALDWARLRPIVSAFIIAVLAALLPGGDQQTLLAILPASLAQVAMALALVFMYRTRGFLAAWLAVATSAVFIDALAARSLDDPDLVWLSRMIMTILIGLVALGASGLIARYLKTRGTPPMAASYK